MTRALTAVSVIPLALLCAGCVFPAWVVRQPPRTGGRFPDLPLSRPSSEVECRYLGLKPEATTFGLRDVQAELAIVAVFDMYCRYCQKAAPDMVGMYREIGRDLPDGRVKMIGIALGNSEFEANHFKDKYGIPFPVFPDPDSSKRMLMGRVGTPSFFGVCLADASTKILAVHAGAFDDSKEAHSFLLKALREAGLAGN